MFLFEDESLGSLGSKVIGSSSDETSAPSVSKGRIFPIGYLWRSFLRNLFMNSAFSLMTLDASASAFSLEKLTRRASAGRLNFEI
jgi:hypothetical protein